MAALDTKTWMSSLAPSTRIVDMTIPGTHDSGAYNITSSAIWKVWAQTQTLSLLQQLNSGVRFLDIRLGWDSSRNVMAVYHGEGWKATYCNIDFYAANQTNTVIGICKTFLEQNTSETIIMSIKEEVKSSDFDSKIISIINQTDAPTKLWYRESTFPTLKDAKGRIILIRRWTTRRT